MKAIDDGACNRNAVEAALVFFVYIFLPLAGVLISKKLYEMERSQRRD
jgi:hypothetical protein